MNSELGGAEMRVTIPKSSIIRTPRIPGGPNIEHRVGFEHHPRAHLRDGLLCLRHARGCWKSYARNAAHFQTGTPIANGAVDAARHRDAMCTIVIYY